jgi:hypothetical protein
VRREGCENQSKSKNVKVKYERGAGLEEKTGFGCQASGSGARQQKGEL